MYVEFGASATDSITLTTTYTATTKTWNILARQIACTAAWKAPTDCVQYFTGISGTVENYNFGNQLIQNQDYDNCIRQEEGYCRIQWKDDTSATPDSFQLDAAIGAVSTDVQHGTPTECTLSYVEIPDGSTNGINAIPTGIDQLGFASTYCGNFLGFDAADAGNAIASDSINSAVISSTTPFTLGVFTLNGDLGTTSPANGFSLDYTQLPC